ncbi:MAG: DUF4163 domain-containing protein [Blastomonas sp.]
MAWPLLAILGPAVSGCTPIGSEASGITAPAGPIVRSDGQRVLIEDNSDLLSFEYSYPRIDDRLPALLAHIDADRRERHEESLGYAREDMAEREKSGFPFNGHYFHKDWSIVASTQKLLVLSAGFEGYSGGAHGYHAVASLFWDQAKDREVGLSELMDVDRLQQLTREDYCTALNAERARRRGTPAPPGSDDMFEDCPAYDDLVIFPVQGESGDNDTMMFIATEYVAGPYAEGEYAIELPISPAVLSAMAPDYRDGFEAR